MAEQLKQIVQALNKAPFSKSFNLVSFDSLEPFQLLQTFSDVLTTIESKPSIDIRQEASDETAIRLLSTLRILKYPAPTGPDEQSDFRQGLVEGKKQVVYPILTWIFPKVEDLQKRLYLAKYLIPVEVPPEFLQDAEVEQYFNEVGTLMEEFKECHKTYEASRTEGTTSEDIREDIQSMEQESEQVTKRIERLKKRVEGMAQKEKMLQVASEFRKETEKEFQLSRQKQEQRSAINHADQKIHRLEQQLKEIQKGAADINPEEMIRKLEEENTSQRYIVEEKLVKEIEIKRKAIQELQKVGAKPALDQKDIDDMKSRIAAKNDEINSMVEQRNLQSDPTEDKLTIYRQQANVVSRKKAAIGQKLQDATQDLEHAQRELDDKKEQYKDPEGNEIVTQTQFKNYVNKLRGKSSHYKKKRQELQDAKAEIGVLSRTVEILDAQAQEMGIQIDVNDAEDDVEASVPSARTQTAGNALEGKGSEDIYAIVKELQEHLKKSQGELLPYTEQIQPIQEQYEEVEKLQTQVDELESQIFRGEAENKIMGAQLERAEGDGKDDTAKKFRDILAAKIQSAETAGKTLRESQKQLSEVQQVSAKQIKMWRDMVKILECKKRCFIQQQNLRSN